MARTMTDEQETEHRHVASFGADGAVGSDRLEAVLAELDAERDAHEATKARLKRAEAVCESCDQEGYDRDALAAWRAGK